MARAGDHKGPPSHSPPPSPLRELGMRVPTNYRINFGRKSMDGTQIERYLGFLGQKLGEMQIKATIILLGGLSFSWEERSW